MIVRSLQTFVQAPLQKPVQYQHAHEVLHLPKVAHEQPPEDTNAPACVTTAEGYAYHRCTGRMLSHAGHVHLQQAGLNDVSCAAACLII